MSDWKTWQKWTVGILSAAAIFAVGVESAPFIQAQFEKLKALKAKRDSENTNDSQTPNNPTTPKS